MKKLMAIMLGLFMAVTSVFASVATIESDGKQVVGERGYVYISIWNPTPDVFACGTKDGTIVTYGLNLNSQDQTSKAKNWLLALDKSVFKAFDHYGCVRARV